MPDLMDTQPGPASLSLSWRMATTATTACFAAAQLLFPFQGLNTKGLFSKQEM